MFTKLATFSVLAAAISSVFASPVDLSKRTSHHVSFPSFNDWHGIKSLHGFDNFYGSHNFVGFSHRQVVLKQKQELVCHRQQVEIIQQRLVVLQEMAKKIITELICEVETQTIVFEQFHAGLGGFRHDLSRKSGRRVGYDAHIAGLYHGIFDKDGSFTDYNFGFRGIDVGKHVIVPSGHNWNDYTSPPIIAKAFDSTRKAIEVTSDCLADNSCDEGIPEISTAEEPDVEVSDASDAPPPDEGAEETATESAAEPEATDAGVEAADAEADDAEADDAEADDAEADDADVESASVTAAAKATATTSSAAATSSANIDPATAP